MPYILELESGVFPFGDLREKFEHEFQHWRVAMDEGLKCLIGIYFISYDGINLRKALQPFTVIEEIPLGMTDEEFWLKQDKVVAGPKDLSESDLMFLRHSPNFNLS